MTVYEKKKISRYNRTKIGGYLMYNMHGELGASILVKKIGGIAELENNEYIGSVISVIGNIVIKTNVKNLNVLKEIKN